MTTLPEPLLDLDLSTTTATGSTTARTLASRLAEIVNVKDYGAKGDGVTNDTIAIQAAATAAQNASPGASVFLPPGFYVTSAAIVLTAGHVRFVGAGDTNATQIISSSPTDDIIRYAPTVDQIGNITGGVHGITFLKSAVSTAGFAISLLGGTRFFIQNVLIYGGSKIWQGINLYQTATVVLEDVAIIQPLADAIVMGGTAPRSASDIWMSRLEIWGAQQVLDTKAKCLTGGAIRVNNYASAIFADGVEIYQSNGYAFYFGATIPSINYGFYGKNLNLEGTPAVIGGVTGPAAGALYFSNFTLGFVGANSWINGKNQYAVVVNSTAGSLFFSDTNIGASQSDGTQAGGLYLNGQVIRIADCVIVGYSTPATLGDGITIDTAGNQIDISDTLVQQMGNGIRANAPGTNSYTLNGVRFLFTNGTDLIGLGTTSGWVRNITYTNGTNDAFVSTGGGAPVVIPNLTVAGPLNTNGTYAVLGSNTQSGGFALSINAAAATNRMLQFMTAGVPRYQFYTDNAAESGANAGSNLAFITMNDAGSFSHVIFSVVRATGMLSVGSGLGVTGNLGFFGTTPVAKPAVTGAKGGNAALGSLLTALASLGLITDSSTA